jgi:Tol biopolymer transport system component
MLNTTLSHYRVGPQLGAGGMGVVYQATDTRLGRKVALKFLHESSVSDPARLARFEREARLLASLSHPNIGSIYGLEREGDHTFLILEYIPGDTLAERLARGPLPVREALDIARQVATALGAAHEVGIIHRDLKPANIKITPDGTVKVLDFGLAKASARADADAETIIRDGSASNLSVPGVVMGTVSYMSPEQASGRGVDHRTDVWALGCVLFEMLTGRSTFPGKSTTEVLVGILDRDPEWDALPAATPDSIRSLLRRCLAKEPRARLHHAADARLELEDTLSGKVSGPMAAAPEPKRTAWRIAAAIVLIAAVAAIGARMWPRAAEQGESPRVVRFAIDLPAGQEIRPSWDVHMTFSRDGGTLLYPVNYPPPLRIHSRRLDSAEAEAFDELKGLNNPFYSPDGKWLALSQPEKRQLVKLPIGGGAPVTLATFDQNFRGDWGTDGFIYWANHLIGPLVRTSENGGAVEPVTELDESKLERSHRFARMLPGGRAVMFTVASGDIDSYDDARIDVLDLTTRKRRTVVEGGTSPRYSPSGHIVYARAGSLHAVPFDVAKLEVTGPPVKVLDGVLMSTSIGTAYFDISPAGDLAYAVGPAESGERTIYWVDRQGNAKPLPLPPKPYLNPRISPDGKRLAIEVEGTNHDLYVFDFEREVLSRVTNDGTSHGPVWSPDGSKIAFRTWTGGKMSLAWMPSDRSAPGERLMSFTAWQSAVSFSPDGNFLMFDQIEEGGPDVWVLPLDGERQPRPFAQSKFPKGAGKFSPDGRWVVYCSLESGRPEIYVQPWPGPGAKIQVSSEGGTDPVWRRDGKEIFYRNGEKMMTVPVGTAGEFRAGRPQLLWAADYMHGLSSSCGFKGATTTSYDVSPDGNHLLMIRDNDAKMFATRLMVVVNWAEELKKRTGGAS